MGEINRSGKLFKEQNEIYYGNYIQGYKLMRQQAICNQDIFLMYYRKQLNILDGNCKLRIVPYMTGDFAKFLDTYLNMYQDRQQEFISQLARGISNTLSDRQSLFVFSNDHLHPIIDNMEILEKAIKQTFLNGTIISMYITLNGVLYLDDVKVGQIYYYDKPIVKSEFIEILAKNFLNKINKSPEVPKPPV